MAWEGGDAIGTYGTPLALMLLPYWTHGRIQSMEGLYFEASATTPYHFMMIATLAQSPSNPVRDLPYRSIADFDLGVRYLQLMGVRYYAAFSDTTKAAAAKNPSLQPVATVPDLDGKPPSGWTIYQRGRLAHCAGAPVPAGGRRRPPRRSVLGLQRPAPTGRQQLERLRVQRLGVLGGAVVQRSRRPRPAAHRRRPAAWKRADAANARSVAEVRRCRRSRSRTSARTESSVAFDVSRTGVPVMVKTSYYPNWKAEGAKGPLAGDAQLHGRGADRQAREAHLRHLDRRPGRAAS